MKTIILILTLFIGLSATAQKPVIFKLKFSDEQTALPILEAVDTLQGVYVKYNVTPNIVGYSQRLFSNDSIPIYEGGYFVDVLSLEDLPELNQYIVDPYPTKFNHTFYGLTEKNAIYKRKITIP